MKPHGIAALALAFLVTACASAPAPKHRSSVSGPLFDEIAAQDRAMFEALQAGEGKRLRKLCRQHCENTASRLIKGL